MLNSKKIMQEFESFLQVERNRWMLLFFVLLIFIRLILMPWLEWRSSIREEIQTTRANLRTPESIEKANSELDKLSEVLGGAEKRVDALLFSESAQELRIKVQQEFRRTTDKIGIRVETLRARDNFNYENQIAITVDAVMQANFQKLQLFQQTVSPKFVFELIDIDAEPRNENMRVRVRFSVFSKVKASE